MDNMKPVFAEAEASGQSEKKGAPAGVKLPPLFLAAYIIIALVIFPSIRDHILELRYENEAQEYYDDAVSTYGRVFDNSEDAQSYLEEQLLCDENIWKAPSGQETDWTADICIVTTDDVDDSFIFAAFGVDTDGELTDTQTVSKGDYIRTAFASSIDYETVSQKYGLRELIITVKAYVPPSDQVMINETSRMIADAATGSDAEKVISISDSIGSMITYELLEDNNICAAISSGRGKCYHYAELFYLACIDAGIDAHIITGDAGGGHAWDIVRIDGKWYHVDPTWQDYEPDNNWLLLGSDEISATHTADEKYDAYDMSWPYSDSNYYS